jgi:hypothetical protein
MTKTEQRGTPKSQPSPRGIKVKTRVRAGGGDQPGAEMATVAM